MPGDDKKPSFDVHHSMSGCGIVVVMGEALLVEGGTAGPTPILMKTSPAGMTPVAFVSRQFADDNMARFNFGPKVWLEPLESVIQQHARWFAKGEIVLFSNEESITKFINDPDFIPLKKIEDIV